MSIRTKLVGAFLIVALLVPLLGGVAMRRVHSINDDVAWLSRDAVPVLATVKDLEKSQREQTAMVLTYAASGTPEDRKRYLDESQAFDKDLSPLIAAMSAPDTSTSARNTQLANRIADERTKFAGAAGQLISARGTVDRNLADLHAKNAEIVRELNGIRRRVAGGNTIEGSSIPAALRRENGDLLLSTEGMLHVVELEFALATAYTIKQDAAMRQQFEGAGLVFTNWLQIANTAGTADDRAILARVQDKFFKEFEPSGRSMFVAADFVAKARAVFAEASTSVSSLLDQIAAEQSGTTNRARGNAETTAGNAATLVVVVTAIAFMLAVVLGVWFAGMITRPIVQLRNAADRISRGDVENAEISVDRNDEVGDLARAFQRMLTSVRILMAREPGVESPDLTGARR